MAVDENGRPIENSIDWIGDANKVLESFMTRMITLVDDKTQKTEVRAKAQELINEVHQKVSAIPASDSAPDKYGKTMCACFRATCAIEDLIRPWVPPVVSGAIVTAKKVKPDQDQDTDDF
jgi:hypothetical protein